MSTFNGNFAYLPGSSMRRRNQQTPPLPTAPPQSAQSPIAQAGYATPTQPIQQQTTPQNGVQLNQGMRYNMAKQAGNLARGQALQTAQGTQGYQQGSVSLDDLRNEFQVNAQGITPQEANLRRQKMFADPRYQAASQQVGTAIAPTNMAGHTAQENMQQVLQGVNYLTPDFFDNRQFAQDANARANAMSGAQVAGMQAETNGKTFKSFADMAMFPTQMQGAQIQNDTAAAIGHATPDMIAADIAGKKAQANANNAQAMQGTAKAVNEMTGQQTPNEQAYQKRIAEAEGRIKDLESKYQAALKQLEGKVPGGAPKKENKYDGAGNTPQPEQGRVFKGSEKPSDGWKPGDVSNGHKLHEDGKWYPIQ